MSSNQEKIYIHYGDGIREDSRSTWYRTSSLEFYYTKKHINGYITKDCRILEIGCATGHYGMYLADKCKEYVGIDLFPSHIGYFNKKIAENNLTNVSCRAGDATSLSGVEDESFDVVLCLGPMYHLPPEERELAFSECHRVCKTDGILTFAYINKIGVYAGACIYDEWREIYPNERANEFILQKGTDDKRPGVFYLTTPEEIELQASRNGLKKLKNLGTDFMITRKIVDDMTDERFELMKPLYDEMTSHESCTGMSNHAVLICRK